MLSIKLFLPISLFISLFILSSFDIFSQTYEVNAFKSYKFAAIEKTELVGRVISISRRKEYKQKIAGNDIRENVAILKLDNVDKLRIGEEIYFVKKDINHEKYSNGFIIGRGKVFSIFSTAFQGTLVQISGFFKNIQKDDFVVRPKNTNNHNEAFILMRKGDTAKTIGDSAKALQYYKDSIEKDKTMPEAYLKLAVLNGYFKEYNNQLTYIREAWSKMDLFEDQDIFLELPGKLLEAETRVLENVNSNDILKINCSYLHNEPQLPCKKIKYAIYLLKEIKKYKTTIPNLKHIFTHDMFIIAHNKGIPKYDFQYFYGKLLYNVYNMLKETSPEKLILWVNNKEDRKQLYEPIFMPYNILNDNKYTDPKEKWDMAYLEGAIYFLQTAHELEPTDLRAAYELIKISQQQLKSGLPNHKKKIYMNLIEHYGHKMLELKPIINQEEINYSIDWNLVKSAVNNLSQF